MSTCNCICINVTFSDLSSKGTLSPTTAPTMTPIAGVTPSPVQFLVDEEEEVDAEEEVDTEEDVVQPRDGEENAIHWSIWIIIAASAFLILGCAIAFFCYRRCSTLERKNSNRSSVTDRADSAYWASKLKQLDTEARLSTGVPLNFDPGDEIKQENERRGSV